MAAVAAASSSIMQNWLRHVGWTQDPMIPESMYRTIETEGLHSGPWPNDERYPTNSDKIQHLVNQTDRLLLLTKTDDLGIKITLGDGRTVRAFGLCCRMDPSLHPELPVKDAWELGFCLWLNEGDYYVPQEGKVVPNTIQLFSIVVPPELRHQGLCKRILSVVETYVFAYRRQRYLIVAPVISEVDEFAPWLRSRGYEQYGLMHFCKDLHTFLEEKDVELVASQTGCTADEARESLKINKNDVVDSIDYIKQSKHKE